VSDSLWGAEIFWENRGQLLNEETKAEKVLGPKCKYWQQYLYSVMLLNIFMQTVDKGDLEGAKVKE